MVVDALRNIRLFSCYKELCGFVTVVFILLNAGVLIA